MRLKSLQVVILTVNTGKAQVLKQAKRDLNFSCFVIRLTMLRTTVAVITAMITLIQTSNLKGLDKKKVTVMLKNVGPACVKITQRNPKRKLFVIFELWNEELPYLIGTLLYR